MTDEATMIPDSRKFLLISPTDHPLMVWIDDEGTCQLPRCKGGDHHLYVDENGRKWAMRCPKSISAREQPRVFWDQPPGAGREQARQFILGKREERRQRRPRAAPSWEKEP